ncbi:MAG: hypothetical protein IPF39_05735 [Comamonadaceae bacterium]|uniref:hypothetical protein n=1 Tax=Candidatus Skiveiella danica TaxID=3386177 RepID=UPI00390AC503|nr:hypothetical protein [Comamonadaceae bacterium]
MLDRNRFGTQLTGCDLTDSELIAPSPWLDAVMATVTNDDFLTAIYGTEFDVARPVVCSIAGDPAAVAWMARGGPVIRPTGG